MQDALRRIEAQASLRSRAMRSHHPGAGLAHARGLLALTKLLIVKYLLE
jgi:hypothetical protein